MEFEDEKDLAPSYDCLLFDLDDTLYPYSSGLSREITKNIRDYMFQKIGIEEEEVPELCLALYKQYGTTLAGLRAIGFNFDYDDFHGFVHGRLPYDEMLKPDPVLRNLLHSLPIRKIIFTNADKSHAAKVLSRLGLEDCFEGIICFETLNPAKKSVSDGTTSTVSRTGIFNISNASIADLPITPVVCKPSEDAYDQVFKMTNINPKRTLFFDDSIRNIQAGKCLGLHTVLVGTSHRAKGADYALESIHNIREALPELWEAITKSERISYKEQIAIETSVRA